jgi:hypothetical protein
VVRNAKPCSREGCDKQAKTRGLCAAHYAHARYHRTVEEHPKHVKPSCIVCGDPNTIARQMCWKHYKAWSRREGNGKPKPVQPCTAGAKHVYTPAGKCLRCGWSKPTASSAPIAP